MRKIHVTALAFILIIVLSALVFNNKVNNRPLNYIDAIDETYNGNINGMSVTVCRESRLYAGSDAYPLFSGAGNKENNFSADSKEGVMLWEAKQLFLSIKSLKALREGQLQILEPHEGEYYVIQTFQDFYGGKPKKLNLLTLFINSNNYHIYIPKGYPESNDSLKTSTAYVEYEPNEITKKLINDIVKQ